MNLRRIKQWQYAAAGGVGGLLLAMAHLLNMGNEPVGGAGFMSRRTFEQTLRVPAINGKPYATSFYIRPATNIDIVTFQVLADGVSAYKEARFAAARPYMPLGAAGILRPSIHAFLLEQAAANPSLRPRYQWWEEPQWACLLWAMAGVVVAGGLWPLMLRWFVGAPPQDSISFGALKVPPKAAVPGQKLGLSEADEGRLAELEAEMVAGLESADVGTSTVEDALSRPISSVRQLSAEAIEPADNAPPPHTDYRGEFYPVEKRPPPGFTLIEILVVIGIIAVLLAILLPILSHMRMHAQEAQCASNMHQIGLGLESYNQTFGHLPFLADPQGLANAMIATDVAGIMTCPSDQSGGYSYSMNPSFAGMPKSAGNATDVLASETASRHDGRSNTLFFDGHVDN